LSKRLTLELFLQLMLHQMPVILKTSVVYKHLML